MTMTTTSSNEASLATSLVIENNLDELITLSDWINNLPTDFELSPRQISKLDLILAEAVTNIIDYAYTDEARHEIMVKLKMTTGQIYIDLIDDGRTFDPTKKEDVVLPDSLEEANIGGLGIYLIRQYSDECHYQRLDNKNILTLIMNTAS